MEHHTGLVVEVEFSRATGAAECEAALAMVDRQRPYAPGKAQRRITLGANKGLDRWDFVSALKERCITPHIAVQGMKSKPGKPRGSAADARTSRHPGYAVARVGRKCVEEIFSWTYYASGQAKTEFRGPKPVETAFALTASASNLIGPPNLLENG